MDRAKKLTLFRHELKLSYDGELLIYTPVRNPAKWLGDPPRLHKGEPAHHLTVPLKPRRNGEDAGKWCPHLTYEDGYRHFLVKIYLSDFAERMNAYARDLVEAWFAQLTQTTSSQLEKNGYVVVVQNVGWYRSLGQEIDSNARRTPRTDIYALSEGLLRARYAGIHNAISWVHPMALRYNPLRTVEQVLHVARAKDDDLEWRQLYRLAQPRRRGWFVGPANTDDTLSMQQEVARKHFGLEVEELVHAVFRELQVDFGQDAPV